MGPAFLLELSIDSSKDGARAPDYQPLAAMIVHSLFRHNQLTLKNLDLVLLFHRKTQSRGTNGGRVAVNELTF